MVTEVEKSMGMKCSKGCIYVKCPYCNRWNEASSSQFYGIEKEGNVFTISFYTRCIRCEEELYYKLKSAGMSAEVLVEE